MSDMQSGVFYPLSFIFAGFPFPLSLNLFILLHIFLAGLFFFLFIRGTGLSQSAGWITSVSYAFGGYTLSSVNVLNNLTVLVWLPAVMWSFRCAFENKSRKFYLATVFFLCCAILGGEPQLFILIAGLLFLSGLLPGTGRPLLSKLKTCRSAVFLVVAAIGITLFQIGPTYIDYQHSVRLEGLPFKEAAQYSLPVKTLQNFVLPFIFPADFTTNPASFSALFPGNGRIPWLLSIYPGFIIVPLAIAGLIGKHFRNTLYWFVLFCISTLLALGDNTPFYNLFYQLVPFFRFPEKFVFICIFSLLVMAAQGITTLQSLLLKRNIRPALVMIFLSAILATDLFVANRHLNPVTRANAYTHVHPDLKPVLDDTSLFRCFIANVQNPDIKKPLTILDHHAKWQLFMMPNLGLLQHINHVGGKSGMELKYQYFMTEILSKSWPDKVLFLKMANVKYIISNQALDKQPALGGLITKISPTLFRLNENLPRAWMVGSILPIKGTTLADMVKYAYDPTRSALGLSTVAARHQSPLFRDVDKIEYEKGNKINIWVDTPKPAVLVLSESAYPGWKVYVDGVEKDVLWLNLFFQGVEINPGHHKIEFVFQPKYLNLFLMLSITTFVILIIAVFTKIKPGTIDPARDRILR